MIPGQELSPEPTNALTAFSLPRGAGLRDPGGQVGRLHRLAVARGPGWGLTRLLRRDGENSAGQTVLFLAALLGHSSAVQLLLAFGASPNHRCLDGSTPVHAGAFSGCSLLMLHVLQAGGDLRLHDQQGRIPGEWAEQGGAKQSWEVSRGWGGVRASGRAAHPASPHVPPHVRVLEPLQLCRAHTSALVHGSELAPTAPMGQLQASSGQSLCGGLQLMHTDRARRPEQIRTPQIPAFGFGQPQRSSLWPLGLVTGGPLADLEELLPAWGGPDCTYESSSHTLMAKLPWRGHPVTVTVTVTVTMTVTVRQLKAPGAQPDVLMPDLQHCSLLLLMALSRLADPSGLCLLFEPALEALLFLQAHWRAPGGLSSHAVQLMRPGLAKVGSLEHGRPLHQLWLRPGPQQGYLWGGPGPGLPPPPELYPWLPLELICGNMLAATSDLYSFCILAQEVFTDQRVTPLPAPLCFHTGELPWAGREGPEVKAELEASESPALDPLVPAPYQALVQAGLGLGPADRWGSLQSTRDLLRKAMAQDSASEVSSPMDWTTLCPSPQGSPPETTYYEVAPRTKTALRPVPPVMSPGPSPSQVGARTGMWRTKGAVGYLGNHASSLPSLSAGHEPQQSPEGCSLGLGQQLDSRQQLESQPQPLPRAQPHSQGQPGPLPGAQINSMDTLSPAPPSICSP
ncbi:hypothetical protein E2I00_015266, partial [Balaenoptera physalus]